MNNCQDCKCVGSSVCLSPKVREAIKAATGLDKPEVGIYLARFEVCKGEWFEAKAPELPEGWRWVNEVEMVRKGDVRHSDGIEQGPCGSPFYPQWSTQYRRRVTPELERCPKCGSVGIMISTTDYFYVVCGEAFSAHWQSPQEKTKPEAASSWNALMRAYREARENP